MVLPWSMNDIYRSRNFGTFRQNIRIASLWYPSALETWLSGVVLLSESHSHMPWLVELHILYSKSLLLFAFIHNYFISNRPFVWNRVPFCFRAFSILFTIVFASIIYVNWKLFFFWLHWVPFPIVFIITIIHYYMYVLYWSKCVNPFSVYRCGLSLKLKRTYIIWINYFRYRIWPEN